MCAIAKQDLDVRLYDPHLAIDAGGFALDILSNSSRASRLTRSVVPVKVLGVM